jgi:hypothetical protein
MRSSIKVWMLLAAVFMTAPAHAFNVLQCQGDIDVRLKGPSVVKKKIARSFTITRRDALELDLSIGGVALGRLFPWDHVVWEADAALAKKFKDVKFKTDDAKLISLSAVDLKTKKAHSFECEFQFD